MPWLPYDLNVRPAWYAVSTLMRHLGPPLGVNTTVSVTTSTFVGAVAIAAVGGGDGVAACHRAFLLVNEGGVDASVQVNISGLAVPSHCANADAVTLQRYAYDPSNVPTDNQPIGPTKGASATASVINDVLRPGAVVVWATS